jgi:protein-tyrosine phosphatase
VSEACRVVDRSDSTRIVGHDVQVSPDRHLDWVGCWNARDLGGIPTEDGRRVRWGAVVRSDSLHRVTDAGWSALQAHGIRTIVDLRDADQRANEPESPPPEIVTVYVPLEEGLDQDPEFSTWASTGWLATPLYYASFLNR